MVNGISEHFVHSLFPQEEGIIYPNYSLFCSSWHVICDIIVSISNFCPSPAVLFLYRLSLGLTPHLSLCTTTKALVLKPGHLSQWPQRAGMEQNHPIGYHFGFHQQRQRHTIPCRSIIFQRRQHILMFQDSNYRIHNQPSIELPYKAARFSWDNHIS